MKTVVTSEVKKGDIIHAHGFRAKVIGIKDFGISHKEFPERGNVYQIFMVFLDGNKGHFNLLKAWHHNGIKKCNYLARLQGNDLADWRIED